MREEADGRRCTWHAGGEVRRVSHSCPLFLFLSYFFLQIAHSLSFMYILTRLVFFCLNLNHFRLVDDHPALGAQQQAWLEMVSFLDARIQASPSHLPIFSHMSHSHSTSMYHRIRFICTHPIHPHTSHSLSSSTSPDSSLQTERHPSGRAPDMSVGAAAALRAVLREMAKEAMPVCRAY